MLVWKQFDPLCGVAKSVRKVRALLAELLGVSVSLIEISLYGDLVYFRLPEVNVSQDQVQSYLASI